MDALCCYKYSLLDSCHASLALSSLCRLWYTTAVVVTGCVRSWAVTYTYTGQFNNRIHTMRTAQLPPVDHEDLKVVQLLERSRHVPCRGDRHSRFWGVSFTRPPNTTRVRARSIRRVGTDYTDKKLQSRMHVPWFTGRENLKTKKD